MRIGKVKPSGRPVVWTSLKLGPDLTGLPSDSNFPILTMTPWKIIFLMMRPTIRHPLADKVLRHVIGITLTQNHPSYCPSKRLDHSILKWVWLNVRYLLNAYNKSRVQPWSTIHHRSGLQILDKVINMTTKVYHLIATSILHFWWLHNLSCFHYPGNEVNHTSMCTDFKNPKTGRLRMHPSALENVSSGQREITLIIGRWKTVWR